jgi:hypothetical protein
MPDFASPQAAKPPEPLLTHVMCDQPECESVAEFSYLWSWGQSGYCCAKHQFLLNQAAQNMNQRIGFTVLAPQQTKPVEREERIQLHAARLAAEDELAQAKQRTAQVYAENQTLVAEVQRLRKLTSELEGHLRTTEDDARRLLEERDSALVELASARDELVRLRTLCDALEGGKARTDADLAVPVDDLPSPR